MVLDAILRSLSNRLSRVLPAKRRRRLPRRAANP